MGIDDFAIKKGHQYATIMINHSSRSIVDMIDTRDVADVSLWLETYPNLETISRDGSIAYKSSIIATDENIIQISDRFHLLKSLSEAVCFEINNIMPSSFIVETIEASQKGKKSIEERYQKTNKNIKEGIPISKACINNKIDIRLFNKIESFSKEEYEKYFSKEKKTLDDELSNERKSRKKAIIKEVNLMNRKGVSVRKIAKIMDLSRKTIARYLDPEYSNSLLLKKKKVIKSSIDEYKDMIFEMYSNGSTAMEIYRKIKDLGYRCGYGMVRDYVQTMKFANKLYFEIKISRADIKSILFHGRNKNIVSRKHLMQLFTKYPKIQQLFEYFFEFKDILLRSKSSKRLEKWKSKLNLKDFKYVRATIGGINRDLEAVKNSLIYNYSNGIVEAKVNVAKLSKRKMYGRCSFNLLKNKVLLMEKYYQ